MTVVTECCLSLLFPFFIGVKIQEGESVRRHRGLCDRDCPKCGRKNSVHWKANVVTNVNEKIVEFGYFFCVACGWRSEYHEIEIERVNFG